MEDSIRLLVENLKSTDNKMKENAFIKQEISSLKNEYRSRISNKSEEIKRTFLNKLSKYDTKINEIDHYCSNQVNLVQNENNKFKEDIRHLKNNLAKEKLETVNSDMENIKCRINLLNVKKDDILKRINNKYLRFTVFPSKIHEWVSSIIIVVIIIGSSITQILGLLESPLQWFVILLLIGSLVYFHRKHKNDLQHIDIETNDLNNSYERLIKEKDIITEEIDKNSDVMDIRHKIDINIGKINNLETEKDRLAAGVKREKNEKRQQLNIECAREIERNKYTINGELSHKINKLKSKYEYNTYFLENESEVTDEYQREDILRKLISYLRNGRASNKKEAVNLYEDEKRKDLEFNVMNDRDNERLDLERQRRDDEKEIRAQQLRQNQEKNTREIELERKKVELKRKEIDDNNRLKADEIKSQIDFQSKKLEIERQRLEYEKQEKYGIIASEGSKLMSKIEYEIKHIESIKDKLHFDPSSIIYKMRQMYDGMESCNMNFKNKRLSINEYNDIIQRIKSDFKEQIDRFNDVVSGGNN